MKDLQNSGASVGRKFATDNILEFRWSHQIQGYKGERAHACPAPKLRKGDRFVAALIKKIELGQVSFGRGFF